MSRAGDRWPPWSGLHQRSSGDGPFKESPNEPYLQKTVSEAADSREALNSEALQVTCCPSPKESPAKSFPQILLTQRWVIIKKLTQYWYKDTIRRKWWKRAVKPTNRYNCYQKKVTMKWMEILSKFFLILFFLLEYNCFTMLCWFLLYNEANQLYGYISPLPPGPPLLSQSAELSSLCYTAGSH